MTLFRNPHHHNRGFTLTELLIVIVLVMLILLFLIINLRTQINKANDAKRKADLNNLQKAFEEYMNDRSCYPPNTILEICRGPELQPYMKAIPCDPTTKLPYLYGPDATNACRGYHVCTKLQHLKDPDITRIGCHPIEGCGWGVGYNYCVAVGVPVTAPGFVPPAAGATPTPTSGPTPPPGPYGCTPSGQCNSYGEQERAQKCTITFEDSQCTFQGVFQCDFPENWCSE